MKKTITLLTLIFGLNFFYGQTTSTLLHNNLQGDPFDIAIYNNELYVSLPEQGKIVKVSVNSTNAQFVNVLTGLSFPTGLSFVNNELYFLEAGDSNLTANTGKLSKINVSQGNPTVTTIVTGLNIPLEMAVNATNAYVVQNSMNSEMEVLQATLTNINLSNNSKANFYSQPEAIEDVEISGSTLYFNNSDTEKHPSYIKKYDLTNSTVSFFFSATNNEEIDRITINGNYIYFSNGYSTSNIFRMPLSSGSTVETVVSNFKFGNDLAYANELVFNSNLLYANAYSYNSTTQTDNYLLYKFDLTTLSADSFTHTNETISFYPNPAKECITFSQPVESLEIYSLEGKKVILPVTANKADVSTLVKGVYLLNVTDNNGKTSISKFIKE